VSALFHILSTLLSFLGPFLRLHVRLHLLVLFLLNLVLYPSILNESLILHSLLFAEHVLLEGGILDTPCYS
jgi:hypothetical protein